VPNQLYCEWHNVPTSSMEVCFWRNISRVCWCLVCNQSEIRANEVRDRRSIQVGNKAGNVIWLLSSDISRVLHLSDRTVCAEQLFGTAAVLDSLSTFVSDSILASESRHMNASLKQTIVNKSYLSAKIIDFDSPSQRGEYSRCQTEAKQFTGRLCFRMSNFLCERSHLSNCEPTAYSVSHKLFILFSVFRTIRDFQNCH